MTHRAGTDVTGQNVTNASTPGYSRQSPDFVATSPLWQPGVAPAGVAAQLGTGVWAAQIKRAENILITAQVRTNTTLKGRLDQFKSAYTQIESIFVQPDEGGLDVLLTDFFASWQALSLAPEEDANRVAVREAAQTLVDAFHRVTGTLNEYKQLVDESIERGVAHINTLAAEIASLNNEIARTISIGEQPNDLLDRRDSFLDELSSLVPVQFSERANRSGMLTVEGRVLVQDQEVRPLETTRNWDNGGYLDVRWSDRPEITIKPETGELGALVYTRDNLVPAFQHELDELARSLVTQVNAVHTRTVDGVQVGFGMDGVTGRDFFQGTDAKTIDLTDSIRLSTRAIQAAEQPVAGDGLNALAIAQLRSARTMGGETLSFDSYYQAVMAGLGAASDSIQRSQTTQDKLLNQLDSIKQQEVGVNLDEEFISLIRYQQGYAAAGRFVSAVDDALDRLINGTGRVGL